MQVIIPAAGDGLRFKVQGYALPKPLITVNGKAMLKHVVERMQMCAYSTPIVVCKPEVEKAAQNMGATTVCIQHTQQGAALSVLCANGRLDDDEEVMVVACDDIIEHTSFTRFVEFCRAKGRYKINVLLTAALPGALQATSRWSYVKGEEGVVRLTAENRPLGRRISLGANYWHSWRELRRCLCSIVASGAGREYSIVPAYNQSRFTNMYYDIRYEDFHTVGTPEELKAYEAGIATAKKAGAL